MSKGWTLTVKEAIDLAEFELDEGEVEKSKAYALIAIARILNRELQFLRPRED